MSKQVCIIPFHHDFLLEYKRMTPTLLGIPESAVVMRILKDGLKVRMATTRIGGCVRLAGLRFGFEDGINRTIPETMEVLKCK